ncbi:MAG: hypothetical protein Q7S34_00340 [bacterium]|nr:hypothetical protein [bacterium]
MDNKKNILITAIVALILLGLGTAFYFYQQPKVNSNNNNIEIVTPNYAPPTPLENKPDLNPADKANPFKGVKTNPFE